MKNLHTLRMVVPFWSMIAGGLLLLLISTALILFHTDDPKWIGLLGGVAGGLVVYGINLLTDIFAFRRLDQLERMQVHSTLATRHDITYYRPVVRKATRSVKVTGTSCFRFITDFLDLDSVDKVLVDQLRRHNGLVVCLLVPQEKYMSAETLQRFDSIRDKIDRLLEEFEHRVQIRRFDQYARHSLVVVDDELIAGPIFQGSESKQAPAIHIDCSTEFGKKYLEYFDDVWRDSEPYERSSY